MAISDRNTAGSQWYAALSPQPHLDGQYTVFGQVTQGLHVLRSMLPGDRIEQIRIERVPTISQRQIKEHTLAKASKEELAATVKPRKKSKRAKRMLAKHLRSSPRVEEPASEPDADEALIVPDGAEQQNADDANEEAANKDAGEVPDDVAPTDEEAPLNEGEKVDFDASEDED